MANKTIHYFVDTNSSCGYVSLLDSNIAGLRDFELLTGYPQDWVNRLYESTSETGVLEHEEVQVIHDCITTDVAGMIFPRRGTGFYNAPLYRQNSRHISGLLWGEYLKEIEKNLGFAYERFGHALKIHDEWEKIFIGAMDFESMNALTTETMIRIIGDCALDKKAKTVHRFFGAATIGGAHDYIENITREIDTRYFIKGRPGTGKSTFLKKISIYAEERGINTEVYHCAFDPNSWDMVVLRELGICLFDSTAPHEYFPSRPGDEVIDIYDYAVKPGTDERFAEEIKRCQAGYKNAVAQATSFLQLTQRIYSDLMLRLKFQLPDGCLEEEGERLLRRLLKE
ncbi:MAG: hypothetical protein ACOX6U_01790 [Oscillospiraceae bacterium]